VSAKTNQNEKLRATRLHSRKIWSDNCARNWPRSPADWLRKTYITGGMGGIGTALCWRLCAGITRDGTFRQMTFADWHAVIDTNLNSMFSCHKAGHRKSHPVSLSAATS